MKEDWSVTRFDGHQALVPVGVKQVTTKNSDNSVKRDGIKIY